MQPATCNLQPALGYLKAADGTPIYAAYHAPRALEHPIPGHAQAVVIAPPLFEERKSSYAALRRLAEALAHAGHAVLRFDYRGSGESGGNPAARRWQDMAEDLAAARLELGRLSGVREVIVLGLRLGGTLALLEAVPTGVAGIIALAPVVNGAREVRLWRLRSKIRAEMTQEISSPLAPAGRGAGGEGARGDALDFDGYPVSAAFFDAVAQLDLRKMCPTLACPSLLVQISYKPKPLDESTDLLTLLGNHAQLSVLRMEPFWDKLDDVDTAPLEAVVLQGVDRMGKKP